MTRTSTKWVTMAIVMILAAGAWAEPKRDSKRKKTDQKPDNRKKIDHDRRERDERKEREERSEHRERGERREREERSAHREMGEEREERGDRPQLRVLKFKHIPAQAYMQVLMQLSSKEFVKDAISDAAIALCEHSNTVVIIAPPRALECFEKLADGVDQPNEFMKNMPPQRGPGMCPCPKAGRGPGTPQCAKCPKAGQRPGQCQCPKAGRGPGTPQCAKCPKSGQRPGQCQCPKAGRGPGTPQCAKCPKAGQRPGTPGMPGMRQCPNSGKGPGRPMPPQPGRGPGRKPSVSPENLMSKVLINPTCTMFRGLLSSDKLRLDKNQKAAILNLARSSQERVLHMRQRVINAIKGMSPKERETNARQMVGRAREALNKMNGEVRKNIFGILKPEQRKLATQILNAPKPTGCRCGGKCPKCQAKTKSRKPTGCSGRCGGKCPKCRAGSKGNPGAKSTEGPNSTSPAPAPARSGGCGGCKTRQQPGIVMSDQGNCKPSSF